MRPPPVVMPVVACPVCRRAVAATVIQRFVYPHNDKAGTRCPMSGHPYPEQVVAA